MSLQMPPGGGGYSRTPRSGIFIPRDLVARDASGEIVPLPGWVGREVLDRMPQRLARDFGILPLRFDPDSIDFLHACDSRDGVETFEKLRFLNRNVTFVYADRAAVERLIDFAWLDGEIGNCDRSLSSQCPGTFQRLAATDDPRCRICPECGKGVRIEASETQRRLRESAGLSYAVPVETEVGEVLQEFVSYSVGADPSEAANAWPAWTPSPRPRFEILERPEPSRQAPDASTEGEEEPPATE